MGRRKYTKDSWRKLGTGPIERGGETGSEPRLPVSRLPFAMGHSYDANFFAVVEVDDGKWKAMHHETASSVQVFRPALGRLHNVADDVGYGYTKFHRYAWAPAAVPSDCIA